MVAFVATSTMPSLVLLCIDNHVVLLTHHQCFLRTISLNSVFVKLFEFFIDDIKCYRHYQISCVYTAFLWARVSIMIARLQAGVSIKIAHECMLTHYFVQRNLSPSLLSFPHLLCLLQQQQATSTFYPTILCTTIVIEALFASLSYNYAWLGSNQYVQYWQHWCMFLSVTHS